MTFRTIQPNPYIYSYVQYIGAVIRKLYTTTKEKTYLVVFEKSTF